MIRRAVAAAGKPLLSSSATAATLAPRQCLSHHRSIWSSTHGVASAFGGGLIGDHDSCGHGYSLRNSLATMAENYEMTRGKPIRCRAAVARAPGEPLVIEEIMVAPPLPHEVRIKIICSSLCHTDITCWKLKEFPAIFPRILGHEAVGVVESVGEGVTELNVGDTVIPTFASDCGECVDCSLKKGNQCSNYPFTISPYMPRYESSRFTDLKGQVLYHFLNVSSFTEYTVVDVVNLVKFDPAMIPPSRACLLSCGISTGFGAAWKTANVEPGSTVVVFGLGAIGLAVAEGARVCGASRIIGVDINPEKAEVGKKFGVTDFINARGYENKSISEVINGMTGGGADYCFECVGQASLVHEAYASCRKGWGKTVVIGLDKPGAQLSFSSLEVLLQGKSIMGSYFGGLRARYDIPVLINHYMNKELHLDDFVTHEVDFENINKAYELLLENKSLRCIINIDK